jgi:PhnB protein
MPGDLPKQAQESKDRIVHASLTKGSRFLMAADTMPGMPLQQGNNFTVSIQSESLQEIESLFAALGEKGKIVMPLQATFWTARFGMLTDQFGINWMFNFEPPKQG